MALYVFEGRKPSISRTAYVHELAAVIGNVTIGKECYVGPGACLRGDWGEILMLDGSNFQENAVAHAGPGVETYLGPASHVGHGAVLHGCRLEEHVLVGMGAVICDRVHIGDGTVIAAGSVLPPGMIVPPRSLVMGVPGKVVRPVDQAMEAFTIMGTRLYQQLPARYAASLEEVGLDDCLDQ